MKYLSHIFLVLYITLCIYVYLPIIVTSTSLTTETVSQGEVEYLELFPWYWSMYSSIHNIVIVAPAKVMHTTIRNVLNHKECSKNNPHCTEIKNKKNNFKFNNQYKRYILNTAIRVLIIRDPYDRSYSAYMNSNHNVHLKSVYMLYLNKEQVVMNISIVLLIYQILKILNIIILLL